MSVVVELATERDDAAIRALLARSALPGRVTVTYEREPSFFAGCDPRSDCAVLVARDDRTSEVVGLACRSIVRLFVNGVEREPGETTAWRTPQRTSVSTSTLPQRALVLRKSSSGADIGESRAR